MHLFSILLIFACSGLVANAQLKKRSANGVPAKLEEFPYIASIQASCPRKDGRDRPITACTGSLIADGFVLTAAHCVAHNDWDPKNECTKIDSVTLNTVLDPVRSSSKMLKEAKPIHCKVEKAFKHPNFIHAGFEPNELRNLIFKYPELKDFLELYPEYIPILQTIFGGNIPIHNNDIGLYKIKCPNDEDKTLPKVNIADQKYERNHKSGSALVSAGWGNIIGNDFLDGDTDILMKLNQTGIPNKVCREKMYKNADMTEFRSGEFEATEICTQSKWLQYICKGDSGGPLVLRKNGNLVGVASWGFPTNICTKFFSILGIEFPEYGMVPKLREEFNRKFKDLPMVYTYAPRYKKWIDFVMSNN